jgi:hypothetical protein
MGFALGKLTSDGIGAAQVSWGESRRSTENAATPETVGARLPHIEGDFTNPMAKFLPIMVAKGMENRLHHGFSGQTRVEENLSAVGWERPR